MRWTLGKPNLRYEPVRNRLPAQSEIAILLYDRLIWLRNHYDVGRPELKSEVLDDIDRMLKFVEETANADQAADHDAALGEKQ